MIESTRSRVKRFAETLALALFDRELESRGMTLTYYYDADVIFNVVMGLESDIYRSTKSADQLLVRALLACGFLGSFYMLRPHAFELNEKLRHQVQYAHKEQKQEFRARARQFLRSKGILDIMSQLHQIATESDVSTSEDERFRVKRFLDILSAVAGKTFAHIEQCNGTWWERFHRYLDSDLLCLNRLGPETHELLETDEDMIHEINAFLRPMRPGYSINVFQDAAALTILHSIIRDKERGTSDEIVRFYTETAKMRRAIQGNKRLQTLLSYERPFADEIATPLGAELVLRDSHYFIIRAWFEELKPGNHEVDSDTLKELKGLSEKLEWLLSLPEEDIERAMREMRHGRKNLSDLVKDFEQLAIMDYVWTSSGIPEDLKNLEVLKQWTRVFEFAERPNTDEVVFMQIQDVREELESRVSRIQIWTKDFKRFLAASERTRKRVSGKIENLRRDLGLVRWGYALNEREKEVLLTALDFLFLEDDFDPSVSASRAATRMEEARHDPRQCLVMCGILWTVGCFESIVDLVKECIENNARETFPPSLTVIQAAAEVRTGRLSGREERRRIVERVWDLQADLPQDQRAGVLLGVGYVLYHAWKQEKVGSGIGIHAAEGLEAEVREWAEKSFTLGEEASKVLPPNELAWAYSINHCAYVGIVAGVEPEKTGKYFERLVQLESFPALWNARFADTVGSYYLLKAERLWEESSPEDREGLDLSRHFKSAREYFEKAKARDIGDIDIDEHINRLNLLEDKYERLKSSHSE